MSKDAARATSAAIKRAIEGRDGRMLANLYADDAIVRVIDHSNPPSRPREIRGRQAVGTFWDDICSRAMIHRVQVTMAAGDQVTFTQDCTYPDGAKVFCIALVEIVNGKIARQTMVQAWDE